MMLTSQTRLERRIAEHTTQINNRTYTAVTEYTTLQGYDQALKFVTCMNPCCHA